MGYRNELIADLEWEVAKLTEIKDKFKAKARELKDNLKQVIAEGKIIEDASEYWKEEYTHASQSRDFYESKWKEAKRENAGLEEHVNYLHKVSNSKEAKLKKEIDRLDSVLTQRTQIIEKNSESDKYLDGHQRGFVDGIEWVLALTHLPREQVIDVIKLKSEEIWDEINDLHPSDLDGEFPDDWDSFDDDMNDLTVED